LPLAEVEEGDDGRLFVLRRVMRDNFIGTFKILGCKLEWNLEEGVRKCNKKYTEYDGTAGLLYGLSLCCNVDNVGE
jgi:hypothetical protein